MFLLPMLQVKIAFGYSSFNNKLFATPKILSCSDVFKKKHWRVSACVNVYEYDPKNSAIRCHVKINLSPSKRHLHTLKNQHD